MLRNFFKQIFNKIEQLDNYTNQYKKLSHNIEIPSLAYTNWAMYFADIKDFETAIAKLETAVLMSNQNPKPCVSLGIIYAKLKEYAKAEKYLKLAVERDSQCSQAYSILSSVLVAESKFEESEEVIKKALKLSPSDAEIYLNYGILYAKQQKRVKAIEMLRKSKFFNPTNPHAYFLLGVMLFELDKIQESFTELKQLEKLKPNYKNLNYYLALCYKKEKNYMAVLEYGQRALEEDANNSSIYILLAQNYISLGDDETALKVFENANKKGIEDFEFYLAWGITLLRLDRAPEAKEKVQNALNINNNDTNALYRMGCCFDKEKDYEKAESYYKQAIIEDSHNTLAIADLGILYYNQNDYEQAINTLFKAINISSSKAYLYFYIANCYHKLGRTKKSIEFYEKTIEYYPDHLEALINCTISLMNIGNIREALRKIRNAYQLNRKNLKVLLVYALVGLNAGIYSDSIEKADLILEQDPNNKDAKLIKAQSMINIRKPQDAINILFSLSETDQELPIFLFLAYSAYKILVEDNPSSYNEKMADVYLQKINELDEKDFDKNSISSYISKTLNINKG